MNNTILHLKQQQTRIVTGKGEALKYTGFFTYGARSDLYGNSRS